MWQRMAFIIQEWSGTVLVFGHRVWPGRKILLARVRYQNLYYKENNRLSLVISDAA